MSGRPEGDGGSGGLPDEWFDSGDRTSAAEPEVRWTPGSASVRRDPDRNEFTREEGAVASFEPNDRVRALSNVAGVFGIHVPAGTEGRVTGTREGLFTSYATVEFANGYTKEVRASELTKLSWW